MVAEEFLNNLSLEISKNNNSLKKIKFLNNF